MNTDSEQVILNLIGMFRNMENYNTELTNIINIIKDRLHNNNVNDNDIINKLRLNHYCFHCYSHFKRCTCGDNTCSESDISSYCSNDEYNSSSIDTNYQSSDSILCESDDDSISD